MPAITIRDAKLCQECNMKSCTIGDVVERKTFTTFRSERMTCPLTILVNGPDEGMVEARRIDVDIEGERKCIYCYLCVDKCSQNNLSIEGLDFWTADDFSGLARVDAQAADRLGNVIATSYLHALFDFAANNNLNRSVSFDGIVYDKQGEAYFVEVDQNDDSLESLRRLLGDMALHNANDPSHPIETGIIVLSNLPKAGSRDVYNLAKQIRVFPKTSNIRVYVTTFQLLRHFMLKLDKNEAKADTLFFEIVGEDPSRYMERLVHEELLDARYAYVQF